MGAAVSPNSDQSFTCPDNTARSCATVREATRFAGLTTAVMPWTPMTCSLAGLFMSPSDASRSASAGVIRDADIAKSAVPRSSAFIPLTDEPSITVTASRWPACSPAISSVPSVPPKLLVMDASPISAR